MELIERFSFFSFKQNSANFIRATYAELKAEGLPLLSLKYLLQSVHDENTSEETLAALLADIPIRWAWATNLNRGEMVLLPFSWFYTINEFNGPSAGNSYEEARSFLTQGELQRPRRPGDGNDAGHNDCTEIDGERGQDPSVRHTTRAV